MIRKILILELLLVIFCNMNAQIPYFAGTVGKDRLYGYTSLKFRPGINAQESYTTFQYGIGDSFATGVDLYTSVNSTYAGYIVRYGNQFNKWFGAGMQFTPSFNLGNNLKLDYLTAALYMNGSITIDKKLFWVSNTWYGINRDNKDTIDQWLYLGYSVGLDNKSSFTPMIGTIYSWKLDKDPDFSLGLYYSYKSFNFYLWGNDLLKSNPRIVIGIDFSLYTR